MNKVKCNIILISHNDLDGVFCGALQRLAYPKEDFNVYSYYCGYDNINQKVKEVIEELIPTLEGNTIVYITDISVNSETAELIDKVHGKVINEGLISFCLLDHHGNTTTLALNKYEWATVSVYMDSTQIYKTSGTRMFFDKLVENESLTTQLGATELFNLLTIVELVRKYDTWEWFSTGETDPDKFNTVFKLYPRFMFVDIFGNKERYINGDIFNVQEEFMIILDEEKKKSYIKMKMKEVSMHSVGGYCAGIVWGEQYLNDVAHAIQEQFPQTDLSIVVTSKALSFRTDREGVDVSKVAQLFGGNGHIKASGAQISEIQRMTVLSDLIYLIQADRREEVYEAK